MPGVTGLSSAEAAARLAAEGPNALSSAGRKGMAAIALEVLREPMLLLLIAAAAVYLLVGDAREALVLVASIAVVVVITVLQERKAERALEALRDLSSPRALVVRDGRLQRIAGRDVVRGDWLVVAEGDRIPADARLASAAGLSIDESVLTGESLAVDKRGGDAIFSGTLVVKGQGRAEVTATGARSEFGRIGSSLAALDSGKTFLERETARIVKLVAVFALLLSLVMMGAHLALRGDWVASVLAGLTLAMGILPEEFPVVLTVFLALGAWRISRHGVLTRRMAAIETLGAATVLCVDKTGTLTENRMAVLDTPQAVIEVAALACEADPVDAMDRAIVERAGPGAAEVRSTWQLEKTYPLTDTFLAVCQVWRRGDERQVAIKGAPETVVRLSNGDASLQQVKEASDKGLRTLGVAKASWEGGLPEDPARFAFRFVGFVALADPLRASVPEAVAQCRRAGIRVVMITGDYPGTAHKIAARAGIAPEDVHARVRPQQKLELVQKLRAAGEVVAMTGDGVNDAPALKAADIGVAMGRRGTDVAREAAALVLLEDDFASMVQAVRLGRRIYDNIRNAMRYIISVHVPIAGMSFLPLALGGPLFLYPVHIVFLEFVIDPACTLVYEGEPGDRSLMDRPPRKPGEPLFTLRMLLTSLGLGATMLCAVLAIYWWALETGRTDADTRTLGFATLVMANLSLILVTRSRRHTLVATLREPNPAAWWILAGGTAALLASIYVPALAEIFRFAPLGPGELAVAAVAGVASVVWYEAYKLLR
jgi:P-type Ca2+ transporter type 2C